MYYSTKRFSGYSTCFRQWRATHSHCRFLHGYAMEFKVTFQGPLDDRNWVMDFGGLRPLKDKLEEWFDHTLLLALDDPHYEDIKKLGELGLAKITEVEKTGCEGIASFLYEYVNTIFLPSYGEKHRIWCCKVEVRETDNNMAMVKGERHDIN